MIRFRVKGPNAAVLEKALNTLAAEIDRVERGRPRLNAGLGVLIDEGSDGFTVNVTGQDGGSGTDIPFPFTPTAADDPENPAQKLVKWEYGTVNGIEPTIGGVPMSEAASVAVSATSLRRAYLEIRTDDALVPTSAEILVAAAVPADVIDYTTPANTRLRVLITSFFVGSAPVEAVWGHVTVYVSINGQKVVVGL